MNAKALMFWGGTLGVAAGAGLPVILPQAPSSIQTLSIVQPIGTFFIDYGNWIVLIGLVLMLVSLFL
jgi:hypothetical protein